MLSALIVVVSFPLLLLTFFLEPEEFYHTDGFSTANTVLALAIPALLLAFTFGINWNSRPYGRFARSISDYY